WSLGPSRVIVRSPSESRYVNASRCASSRIPACTRQPRVLSASRACAPTSSLPTARKKSTSAPSRTSSPAASAPPPPGSSQLSAAVTIAPASGTRSTRAKRTHSTCPTTAALTDSAYPALEKMMALVHVPPFESFYEENQDAVLRELRRLLGREAEDAYQ